MDLQKHVTLRTSNRNATRGGPPINEGLSLFEAVRRLTQDEEVQTLVIEDGVKILTDLDILEITKSQEYKDLVLAFDERR